MVKSPVILMFEELSGLRAKMVSTLPEGLLVQASDGERYILVQYGPDLEVTRVRPDC